MWHSGRKAQKCRPRAAPLEGQCGSKQKLPAGLVMAQALARKRKQINRTGCWVGAIHCNRCGPALEAQPQCPTFQRNHQAAVARHLKKAEMYIRP